MVPNYNYFLVVSNFFLFYFGGFFESELIYSEGDNSPEDILTKI